MFIIGYLKKVELFSHFFRSKVWEKFTVIKKLKSYLIDLTQQVFFPLQILLTWVAFKFFTFLKVPILDKILLTIVVFVVVSFGLHKIMGFVMNNILFQAFLFLCLKMVDVRPKKDTTLFCLVVGISFFCPFIVLKHMSLGGRLLHYNYLF